MHKTSAQRMDELFRQAVLLPRDQRSSFLADACCDDAALRAEVEDLLEHDELAPPGFLRPPQPRSHPPLFDKRDETPERRIGTKIGRYRVTAVIATGGMGTVYEAEQENPRRVVALKIMRAGIASRQAMRRFEFESQILARLRHPNIAQVFEAGISSDEVANSIVPYFAMEFVPGARTITDYARQSDLGTRKRLELFIQVCEAVHHGHQRGVIHRDLKPSNILVDAAGMVKVIDFGVARSTDSDLAITTLRTDVGQLIGTLQYMSPEQCNGDASDLDVRSDIYSLGVVLYELLCEQLPYDVKRSTLSQAARTICEQSPARLSTVNRALRGDVDTIVLKALEKDREQRYQSAVNLARDIRRYLADEPITARPPTTWYQFSRFAKRNRGFVGAIGVAALAVLASIVALTVGWTTADRANSEAQVQTRRACLIAAEKSIATNDIKSARENLEAIPAEFRNWKWKYLWAETDQSIGSVTIPTDGPFYDLEINLDAARVAASIKSGDVLVLDRFTGEVVSTLRGLGGPSRGIEFSPNGMGLAASDESGNVCVWNLTAPATPALAFSPLKDSPRALAMSYDGRHLATGSTSDGSLCVWNALTGDKEWCDVVDARGLNFLRLSPDGRRVAVACYDRSVRIWDADSGEESRHVLQHEEGIRAITFAPSGAKIATVSGSETVSLWDMSSGRRDWSEEWGNGAIRLLRFDATGRRLAAGYANGLVRVKNLEFEREPTVLRGHSGGVPAPQFEADGRRLITASVDGTVRTFSTDNREALRSHEEHDDYVRSVVFTPDGTRVASGGNDNMVRLWDAVTGETLAVLSGHEAPIIEVVVSTDGAKLASASEDGTIRLWNAWTGRLLETLTGHEDFVTAVAFSPSGALLASASQDSTVRVWDLVGDQAPLVLDGHSGRVQTVAFSPDGSRLASAGNDGTVVVWDVRSWRRLPPLFEGAGRYIQNLKYSADGLYLSSGAGDGTVCIWDTFTGDPVRVFTQPPVSSVAFSPDGDRLVTGSSDSTVRLWNTINGEEVLVLRGHKQAVNSVAFSLDGTTIASASEDYTVRLWHTVPFADRFRRRQTILDAAPQAKRLVESLYEQLADWNEVAARIREDLSLSAPTRHAALNEVLRRAVGSAIP